MATFRLDNLNVFLHKLETHNNKKHTSVTSAVTHSATNIDSILSMLLNRLIFLKAEKNGCVNTATASCPNTPIVVIIDEKVINAIGKITNFLFLFIFSLSKIFSPKKNEYVKKQHKPAISVALINMFFVSYIVTGSKLFVSISLTIEITTSRCKSKTNL